MVSDNGYGCLMSGHQGTGKITPFRAKDGTTATIRLTTVDDADATFRLFTQVLDKVNESYPNDESVRQPTSSAAMWELFMRWGPCCITIVDDKVVGLLLSNARDPHVLEIVNLFVEEEYRGRGYARQMLELFERRAAEDEYHTAMTSVNLNWNPQDPSFDQFFIHHGYDAITLNSENTLFLLKNNLQHEERAPTRQVRIVLD
jgi:GNAT superfamily N-acetyltransferase